ncbi:hypothetical protein LEMLEM_LOCUS18631 [Lemmus lemmus]
MSTKHQKWENFKVERSWIPVSPFGRKWLDNFCGQINSWDRRIGSAVKCTSCFSRVPKFGS